MVIPLALKGRLLTKYSQAGTIDSAEKLEDGSVVFLDTLFFTGYFVRVGSRLSFYAVDESATFFFFFFPRSI